MSKITLFFAISFFLFHTVNAELKVPELTGRVVDNAKILSSSEKQDIENAIMELEKVTGGQMAVLIIPSLDGAILEEFSRRVADKWEIGNKGRNNGLILLVSKGDQKIRIEVGTGWEEQIYNAKASKIIRGMGPQFRRGSYSNGILYAVSEVQKAVTKEEQKLLTSSDEVSNFTKKARIGVLIIFGFVIFFGTLYFLFATGIKSCTFGADIESRIRPNKFRDSVDSYGIALSYKSRLHRWLNISTWGKNGDCYGDRWGGSGGSSNSSNMFKSGGGLSGGQGGSNGGGFSGGGGGFSGGGASGGW